MSDAERQAFERATTSAGDYRGDLETARGYATQAAQPFTSFDVDAYMNPYIQGALDPAAREIREELARQQAGIGSRAAEMDAFGGSRSRIAKAEMGREGLEAVSDLYGRGYATAFESARDQINRDRDASRGAAEQFRSLGTEARLGLTNEIQNLLTVGGLERNLRQAGLDFDYQQFVEARDWDITNLQPLLAALSTVPYGEKITSTTESKKSALSTVAGIGMVAFGAMTGNPALIAGGLGSMSGGGAPEGMPTSFPGQEQQQLPTGGGIPGATPPFNPYAPPINTGQGTMPGLVWGPQGPELAPKPPPSWGYAGGTT